MGSVRALVVVDGDSAPDTQQRLQPIFPGVQINALIFQRPPKTRNQVVVDTAPFTVHRDACADPFQPASSSEGREL